MTRHFLILATVLAVAACADAPADQTSSPDRSVPLAAPSTVFQPARPSKPAVKPAPPAAAPRRLDPAFAPERLKGMDENSARRLLGEPTAAVDRAPARIWTYDKTFCRVELSFYMDVSNQVFRVLSYDLAPKGQSGLTGADCLAQLKSAPGSLSPGSRRQ